ncbi:rhodanese domain-containing protein CG4456-like isoform X2 [Macrobrachium rosenbergii]|uniref:rhodanese domain-containing protein CG4456-like isoform X2 n=1 Tax=Macrobrachium rosenbergii TaxID=79674 RepID=UPI0034D667D2
MVLQRQKKFKRKQRRNKRETNKKEEYNEHGSCIKVKSRLLLLLLPTLHNECLEIFFKSQQLQVFSETIIFYICTKVLVYQLYFAARLFFISDIEFEELKQRVERNDITVIDVRTPKELTQIGMIPNSKNIKVQSFGPDILLPDDKFAEKFGFKKPALDEPIAVICLAGIRARTAQLAMMAVGYSNVRVYVGSMEDWLEKKGPVVF